jgi:sugar phosphate isomerase/epimerase
MRGASTWSLHRTLGRYAAPDSAALGGPFMASPPGSGGMALLNLPDELRRRGYDSLHICHFHLPSRTPDYLAQLREALAASDIKLEVLLIDDGDFTDTANADQVEAWIGGWLDVATALDATRARVSAGRSAPTPERLRESARRIVRLAESHPGVRVVIENWMGMLPDADSVLALIRETADAVGLLIDLGNWSGPDKYDELAGIAPLAESCHAKCHFVDGNLDAEDFRRSLTVLKDAGYQGFLTYIYDGSDDNEWDQLDAEYEIARSVFA